MQTSSHQLIVDVTGSQYPELGVVYSREGSHEGIFAVCQTDEMKR